jgi:type I restriction enzyme S subunit
VSEKKPLHIPSTAAQLQEHWHWERLDEVCSGTFDCPHSTPLLTTEGPFVVRSQDVRSGIFRMETAGRVSDETYKKRIARAEPRYGDLVYSREGTYFGIAAELPPGVRVCLGQRMVLLRPNEHKAHFRFLRYWLNSPVMARHIHGHRDGTVAERLNMPTIRALPVALPPLSEQCAIAAVLSALDDKIELNQRMNETLEAMARALFQNWFVDACLRQGFGRQATQAALPKGWRVERVYAAADVIYGAPFSSAKFNKDRIGKPLIRIRDLADEAPEVFTPEEHPKGYLVKPGDIVVGMDGEFRAHLWGGEESWLNQRVCVFAPKPGFSAPFVLNSIVGLLAEVEATETATTVIHIGKNDIDRLKIVVPEAKTLDAFNRTAEPMFKRIVINKQESRTLAALRDALLPKLLSGELRVPTGEQELASHA